MGLVSHPGSNCTVFFAAGSRRRFRPMLEICGEFGSASTGVGVLDSDLTGVDRITETSVFTNVSAAKFTNQDLVSMSELLGTSGKTSLGTSDGLFSINIIISSTTADSAGGLIVPPPAVVARLVWRRALLKDWTNRATVLNRSTFDRQYRKFSNFRLSDVILFVGGVF